MRRSSLRKPLPDLLPPLALVALFAGAAAAALAGRGADVPAPACAKCKDIAKMESELAQQKPD